MHIDIPVLSEQTSYFLTLSGEHTQELQQHIQQLRHALKQHNYLYYVTASPIISDGEYDQLFRLLQERESYAPELITSDSPTQQLSGQLLEGFTQEEHLGMMQSLQNTYNAEEIKRWHEGLVRLLDKEGISVRTYLIEPKFDGMSVEIVYEKGLFVRAVTRGNGKVGEDITEHAKMIHGLPGQIKDLEEVGILSLRGEIVMPKKAFERLGTQEMTSGGLEFANPRNATAGTLRHLNPQLVKKRGLAIEIYECIFCSDSLGVTTATELRELFTRRGLHLHPWIQQFGRIEEVIAFCESSSTAAISRQQELELDGLVVKVNELEVRQHLGSTNHHPRRAIAYKFPAQQVTTQLENVTFQVGRTGILTPVAHLTPVHISGVKVQRATLHNRAFIQERDLHLHDWVVVQRSGEVIPYIVSVVKERRTGQEKPILQPKNCPVCLHEVYVDEEAGSLRCGNASCPAQIKHRLQHFASKGCLDIAGLGPRLVEICVDAGLLHRIPDIYTLLSPQKRQQLLLLPGIGAKKVASLEKELHKATRQPVWRVLFGLSIRHVGSVIAQEILKAYEQHTEGAARGIETFVRFCQAPKNLLAIYGIGPEIAESVVHFFEDAENRTVLDELDRLAVINRDIAIGATKITLLSGKQVVITGTFPFSRIDLTNLIQQQGAKVTSSVTKQTDTLLVGDSPGSKLKTAQELGITILSLDEFVREYCLPISEVAGGLPDHTSQVSQTGLFD